MSYISGFWKNTEVNENGEWDIQRKRLDQYVELQIPNCMYKDVVATPDVWKSQNTSTVIKFNAEHLVFFLLSSKL